jgi:hypothetical protein
VSHADESTRHARTPNISKHNGKSASLDDDDEDDQDLVLSSGLNLVGSAETGQNAQEIPEYRLGDFLVLRSIIQFSWQHIFIALLVLLPVESSICDSNGTNIRWSHPPEAQRPHQNPAQYTTASIYGAANGTNMFAAAMDLQLSIDTKIYSLLLVEGFELPCPTEVAYKLLFSGKSSTQP